MRVQPDATRLAGTAGRATTVARSLALRLLVIAALRIDNRSFLACTLYPDPARYTRGT